MKTWAIIIGVVVALGAAVLGTIYYVGGTPQYSLYLIRKAVNEGDRDTFYHHFDVTKVVTHAVERAVGGVPAGPRIVSQKANEMLIPAADALIRDRIDERFDDPSSAPAMSMKVDQVRYQNNYSFVTLKDPSDGSMTIVTLERMPDRQWEVVDLDLSKVNVEFSLDEARSRAKELLPPEMPDVRRPNFNPMMPQAQ